MEKQNNHGFKVQIHVFSKESNKFFIIIVKLENQSLIKMSGVFLLLLLLEFGTTINIILWSLEKLLVFLLSFFTRIHASHSKNIFYLNLSWTSSEIKIVLFMLCQILSSNQFQLSKVCLIFPSNWALGLLIQHHCFTLMICGFNSGSVHFGKDTHHVGINTAKINLQEKYVSCPWLCLLQNCKRYASDRWHGSRRDIAGDTCYAIMV